MPKLSCSRYRRAVLVALIILVLLPGCTAKTQVPSLHGTFDVTVGYTAEHSLRANSDQNFWLHGGSAEAGVALWHGLGPAVDVTGANTRSVVP